MADISAIAPLRRQISTVLSAVPFETKTFGSINGYEVVEQGWKEFAQFVSQFQSFENCLLGLAGNPHDADMVDLRRLLHILLENAVEDKFGTRIIPHPSPPISMNAQQHARVCSVVTSYRLIDIMAHVGGLSLGGSEVSKGSCSMEKELKGYKRLMNWPALCFKFQDVFKATTSTSEDLATMSGGRQLLEYIEQNVATTYGSKVTCNLLVTASHLAFLIETHFSANTLPDLPDFINDERIMSSKSTNEQEFLVRLRKLIQDYDLRSDECSYGLSLSSFRAALHLAANISPLYLLMPITIAKSKWNRQTINELAVHLGNHKPEILIEVEKVIWRAVFLMAAGKMSPPIAISFIKENINWTSLQARGSGGTEDLTDFFQLQSIFEKRRPLSQLPSSEPTASQGHLSATPAPDSTQNLSTLSPGIENDPLQHNPSVISQTSISNCNTTMSKPDSMDVDMEGGVNDEEHQTSHGCQPPLPSGDIAGADQMDEDDDENGVTSQRGHLGEEQSTGNAAGGQSDPMVVDESNHTDSHSHADGDGDVDKGNGKTNNPGVDEDKEPRRSTRIQAQQEQNNHQTEETADDARETSKSKPKPKPKPAQSKPKPKPEPEKPSDNTNGIGTQSNPIDIDFLHQGSLWDPDGLDAFRLKKERTTPQCSVTEIPGDRAKCKGDLYVFTASGQKVRLEPEFHYESYAIRFSEMMRNVQEQYDNDVPPHCQNNGHSVIHTLTWDEYNQMKPEQLQKILSTKKNIVVSGHSAPTPPDVKFDEDGLEQIFSVHDRVSLQDYSLYDKSSDDDDDTDQEFLDQFDRMTMHLPKTVAGTLQDVLASSKSNKGMILNALDLPLTSSDYSSSKSFSSDKTAYHFTKTRNSFILDDLYPFEDVNWGLIGTKDTITFIHIDSDGLCTHLYILCGGKIWFFLRPKQGLSVTSEGSLSSSQAFLNDTFRLDRVLETAYYDLEAVALSPGDFLIMPPNQPHAVYGYKPTVCVGGHFYLTHLMETTAQGLLHAFVINEFITNTYHYPSRALLRRILDFCRKGLLEGKVMKNSSAYTHIPDLNTLEGIINLLSLCNLVILGNVLDFRTYLAPNQPPERNPTSAEQDVMDQYDRNKIPKQERAAIMYYRGLAYEVINWVNARYQFWDPEAKAVDLPSHYLTQQLLALLKYKSTAENMKGYAGAPHCTLSLLEKQVHNIIKSNEALKKYWLLFQHRVDDSQLGFGDRNGWGFQHRESCQVPALRTEDELIDDGTTELDQKFKDSDKSLQSQMYKHHGNPRKRPRSDSLS